MMTDPKPAAGRYEEALEYLDPCLLPEAEDYDRYAAEAIATLREACRIADAINPDEHEPRSSSPALNDAVEWVEGLAPKPGGEVSRERYDKLRKITLGLMRKYGMKTCQKCDGLGEIEYDGGAWAKCPECSGCGGVKPGRVIEGWVFMGPSKHFGRGIGSTTVYFTERPGAGRARVEIHIPEVSDG